MTEPELEQLNLDLQGFSDLVQFDLAGSPSGSCFGLRLTLANAKGDRVVLVCDDVQDLELNPAGSGFQQLLRLEVTDMREHGLDRVHFSVEEMEREALFLHCGEVALQRIASA